MSQDTISLTLEPREVTGKAVKHLRKEGTVPAVIHDHGSESVIVQANGVQLLKVWQQAGKHHPVELTTAKKKYVALIKAADFDPRKHLLTHVVFNAVNANEQVEAEVPVEARFDEGNDASPAERAGLLVLSQLDAVTIKTTPGNLPDVLYYNAEKLVEVGDHVTVADLDLPSGIEMLTEDSHPLATVFEPSAMQAANDAAGGDADISASDVAAEHGTAASDEDSQAQENHPGGKKEFEAKGE